MSRTMLTARRTPLPRHLLRLSSVAGGSRPRVTPLLQSVRRRVSRWHCSSTSATTADGPLAQVTLNSAGPGADLGGCTYAHQKVANARAALVAPRLLCRNVQPTSQGSRFNGEHGHERDDRYHWSGAGDGFDGRYAGIGASEGFAFLATAMIAAAAGVVAIADDAKNEARVAFRTGPKSVVTDHYVMGDLLGEGAYGSVHMATRKAPDGRRESGKSADAGVRAVKGNGALDGRGVTPIVKGERDSAVSTGGSGVAGAEKADTAVGPGTCVAIKKVDKEMMDQEEFMQEFAALKTIHDAGGHPNIAGMEEMFEDAGHFYLVLELVSGGELFEHLIRNGAYSEQTAAALLRDLAAALRFLHHKGIVHADLKPENLMLSSWDDANARVKLVDFGCSCGGSLGRGEAPPGDIIPGTPAYWPPELVDAVQHDVEYRFRPAADMWAMGVIMFIMLVGVHPFDLEGGASDTEILRRVSSEEIPTDKALLGHVSAPAMDVMKRLLEKDPKKRMTADEMLRHPWTTGEKANQAVMEGVDEKLASFQEVVRSNLEQGLFAILVQQSLKTGRKSAVTTSTAAAGAAGAGAGETGQARVEEAVGVIRTAFGCFDREGKGFVSAKDISRVLAEAGEGNMTEEESSELDLALSKANGGEQGVNMESFEKMMSSLENVVFQRGDEVFAEGDDVEASPYMYILGSGKVDVLKQVYDGSPPAKLTSLSDGEIFGEAEIIAGGKRSTTVRCATPVQAVRIRKDSLGRMMKGSKAASANLREMAILRDISRAKTLLRAVGNIAQTRVPAGGVVVRQGDLGDSMYTVVEGNLDVLVKGRGGNDNSHGNKVAVLSAGDMFGEMALMLKQPRSATVLCSPSPARSSASSADGGGKHAPHGFCIVNEIKGEDFVRMLKHSEHFLESMKVILRTRMFRRAMMRLSAAGGADALSEEKMRAAFDMLDMNKSGNLDAEELLQALQKLESDLSEEDVRALMNLADLNQDGSISFEEFCRILRWEGADRDTGGGDDEGG